MSKAALPLIPRELDAAPFCAWVRAEVKGRFQGSTSRAARAMEVSDRTVLGWMKNERSTITSRTADRVLMNIGTASLEDLWPEQFPDIEAA
jgi:hypothetical protein